MSRPICCHFDNSRGANFELFHAS